MDTDVHSGPLPGGRIWSILLTATLTALGLLLLGRGLARDLEYALRENRFDDCISLVCRVSARRCWH